MLVMVVFFIAFRWIHLSTPLIRLFLLVLILLLMPTLNFLPVWFALSLLRFRLPSRLPMMFILWMVARSEERFSRNAETDLVCRLLLEKKNALCHGIERRRVRRPGSRPRHRRRAAPAGKRLCRDEGGRGGARARGGIAPPGSGRDPPAGESEGAAAASRARRVGVREGDRPGGGRSRRADRAARAPRRAARFSRRARHGHRVRRRA